MNPQNQLEHKHSKPNKHEIEICSDEENIITGIEVETAFSVIKMDLEAYRGLEYLQCMNQSARINLKGPYRLKYLNTRNARTAKRIHIF